VFEIKNSKRLLAIINAEIESDYEKKFSSSDSVIVLNLSKQCKITRYGYAKDDEDLIII